MEKIFEGVTGQNALKQLLSRSLDSGRISHAYIFEGDVGMGKKTLALSFARHLVCENKTACNLCRHCKLSLAGNHPDIITLTPDEGKQSISVDNIRSLYETVMVKPFSADKKVIIIPGCEKMGVPAQNALLKMLEEPPSYVVFILLTTNSSYFLDTVLSRSIKLSFNPYTDEEIRKVLLSKGYLNVSEAVISCADGNIGKALSLVSSDTFLSMRKDLISLFDLFFDSKTSLFDIVSYFEKNKDSAEDIFDILLYFARELVFLHLGGCPKDNDFNGTDYLDRTTLKGCMAFMNKIIEFRKMLLSNANYSLLINAFVFGSKEVLGW